MIRKYKVLVIFTVVTSKDLTSLTKKIASHDMHCTINTCVNVNNGNLLTKNDQTKKVTYKFLEIV